jgi:hypothetical protein
MAKLDEKTERSRTIAEPKSSSRLARKIEPQIQTRAATAGEISR